MFRKWSGVVARNRWNAQHLDAGSQGRAGDAESLAGVDLVPLDVSEDAFDDESIDQIADFPVDVAVAALEEFIDEGHEIDGGGLVAGGRIAVAEVGGKMVGGQDFTDRIDDGESDGALQFADVSGPIVALQSGENVGMD